MGRSQIHRYWWTIQNPVDNDVLQMTSGKRVCGLGALAIKMHLVCGALAIKKRTRVLDRASVQFF